MKFTVVCCIVSLLFATSWIPNVVAQEGPGADQPTDNTDRLGIEQPSGFARAALAFWQTLYGVGLGGQLCVLLECDEPRLTVGAMVLGGGTGLGLSLWATQDGITSGHVDLINSATMWGWWDTFLLSFVLDTWGNEKTSVGLMMAGELGGLGAGIALWDTFKPNSGDIALLNSSAVWSGILTAFVLGATQPDLDSKQMAGLFLATTNAGALAGAYLASTYPMSWGRVFVINAGGIVGALTGFGTAYFIAGNDLEQGWMFSSAIAGTLAGLGAATYFTQDWELMPGSQASSSSSPTVDVLSLRVAF